MEYDDKLYRQYVAIAKGMTIENLRIALNQRKSLRPEVVSAYSLVISEKQGFDNDDLGRNGEWY